MNKKNPSLHRAMRLSGAGLQMLVIIFLFHRLGTWLDSKLNKQFLETLLTLFGIVIAVYLLIKQANKLNR